MVLNMTDPKTGMESVSPVTLSSDWSRLARVIFFASLATIGCVGNVFMISAIMIEDYLRRRGNTFVAGVALADLLVTGVVIPASCIVILADLPANHLPVCKFQWFLSTLSFLVCVLSLAAISCENLLRLCSQPATYERLTTRSRITALFLVVWVMATITSSLQFATDLTFDYCTRGTSGLIPYQATVGVVFVFLPILLTFFCYVRALFRIRKAKKRPNFKPPITFNWDLQLMHANLCSFVIFVLFWLPFGVVLAVGTVTQVHNSLFYKLAWLGMIKSVINSILYCCVNRHFRSAYVNLFHYCCCKTTVTFSRRQRGGGAGGDMRPSGDVRVHIIPGYNMYCSPQRAGRDGQSKRCSARPSNGREVYEL